MKVGAGAGELAMPAPCKDLSHSTICLPPRAQLPLHSSSHRIAMSNANSIAVVREIFENRFSVREFADTPVPAEIIADLLHLAQRAPTAFNTQPYVIIALRSIEDRMRLEPAMFTTNKAKVTGAPLVIVFAADLEPSHSVDRIQRLRLADGVPETTVSKLPGYLKAFSGEGTQQGSLAWAYKQATFAASNLLTAATAYGLATCPMEGFDGALVNKALDIPDRYSVPIVISVGYAKEDTVVRLSSRLTPKEVCFEGRFGSSASGIFGQNELDDPQQQHQ